MATIHTTIYTGPNPAMDCVDHLTINCLHISATINGQPVDIRGGASLGDDWFDKDHRIFAEGMWALQRMIEAKTNLP